MAGIGHLTNRAVEVWRNVRTSDGAGGYTTVRVYSHDLDVRISSASMAERSLASSQAGDVQGAAELTHVVYADGLSDVLRGDQLRDTEFIEWYRVLSTRRPSVVDAYTRVDCQLVQIEPEAS